VTDFREPFPIVYAADVERSVRFYVDGFGFEQTFRWPPSGGPLEYAFLRLGEHGIGIGRGSAVGPDAGRAPERGSPARFELCIYADDVDRAAERLRALGARELAAPEDMPWNERIAYFEDPDGNPIHVAARIVA
jgi:catechol 2,3-dioxygenase-like lactoylglutathione lyase family enzyme